MTKLERNLTGGYFHSKKSRNDTGDSSEIEGDGGENPVVNRGGAQLRGIGRTRRPFQTETVH